MQLNCLSIVLWWASFLLTDIQLPDFKVSVKGANLSNVTISEVNLGKLNATIDSSRWSLVATTPSVISGAIDVQKRFLVNSRVFMDMRIDALNFSITKSSNDGCLSNTAVVDYCTVDLKLSLVKTAPKNPLFTPAWVLFKKKIEGQVRKQLCDELLPFIAGEIQNHTVNLPPAAPLLVSSATPLSGSRLFTTLVNVMNNIPTILGVNFAASLDTETALRIGLRFPHGIRFPPEGLLESIPDPDALLKDMATLLETLGLKDVLGDLLVFLSSILPDVDGGFLGMSAPNSAGFSVQAALRDLRCETGSLRCSLPLNNSIEVRELRTENFDDFDRLVTHHVSPLAAPLMSTAVDRIIALFAEPTADERFFIPAIKETPSGTVPATAVLVPLVVGCFLLLVGTALLSVWRQRRSPITMLDGTPVSLKRVLMEDMFLMGIVVLAMFGFTWSNTTIGATLRVGKEINVLSFSLWESTRNLYEADVRLFAVLVFFFSGVYPYVKLTVIVLCTLVFQKPDLALLRVVDFFGKFALVDSFGMIAMAGGLQLKGIAEVHILPGFYLFMIATLLSMFLGNYATRWWRIGTTVRGGAKASEPVGEDDENDDRDDTEGSGREKVSKPPVSTDDENEPRAGLFWTRKRIFLHALHGALIIGCVLPAWVTPCLGYSVTGVARLIQPEERKMTLFALAKMNVLFIITCAFTLFIAPVLYGVVFPRWSFLVTWCASDAFLLACVAGLLQVNRFVRFILGENMDPLYSTDARLLWPLVLLLILSIWQWILAAEDTFHLIRHIKRYLTARKNSASE